MTLYIYIYNCDCLQNLCSCDRRSGNRTLKSSNWNTVKNTKPHGLAPNYQGLFFFFLASFSIGFRLCTRIANILYTLPPFYIIYSVVSIKNLIYIYIIQYTESHVVSRSLRSTHIERIYTSIHKHIMIYVRTHTYTHIHNIRI